MLGSELPGGEEICLQDLGLRPRDIVIPRKKTLPYGRGSDRVRGPDLGDRENLLRPLTRLVQLHDLSSPVPDTTLDS